MVVGEASINNIMSGIENAGGVKQHNHKKKLKQRFDIIRKLGQGTFGKVQLGINKETGQAVAIKTIKKSKIESEADLVRIRREIQIMSSVQHPNIIHIYEVFENKEKMVLVMEYAAGGELYDYLSERKVLNEDEARRIFRQIATACYYCHKHKICHRDLKLENILLDVNNNAKIADFGLSNVFDDQRLLSTFCGSPLYASPEIVKGTPYNGPEVDCWSLGVLLYTLVYGAMPFDGSNFKRLVKQISQGDYFEPAKPSPASPLIRDMLTVNPKSRANIEKICTHWWVNETYDENCLEISEELANQTPVRLDLLLSLAPPPPQLESEKLLVTEDAAEEIKTDTAVPPTRSQSVGSVMELAHPAERRIKDMMLNEEKTPKRKLENTVSTDRMRDGLKKKDKIIKENTIADITLHGTIQENASMEDASMTENLPLDKSMTQTIVPAMEVEPIDPSLEGAACAEILEEAETKKPSKIKKNLSTIQLLEGINEIPSQENINKENIEEIAQETKGAKKKVTKKKVLAEKNEEPSEEPPNKPIERRRSRIFEVAEKFQNMISPTEIKPVPVEKPKKIVIPGVSVDGFKKEFERKASLTSTSPPKIKATPSKKVLIDQPKVEETPQPDQEKVKNAVSIISSALDKEGTRKSKSRPCCVRKPPVPFGASGRSASGNIGMLASTPKPFVRFEAKRVEDEPAPPVEENQTSSAEITLKSATLPRRKTTKAEIQLNYPVPKPATMEFKTEMAHNVTVPIKSPEPKERIIPISFDAEVQSPPTKPPVSRIFQSQKSNQSQRSLSRQSTQDSDTETASGEPIRKSPREYIIPIAVEGGGYVTPRSGSVEPSESTTSTMTNKSRSKFGRARRMNSLFSDRDSEDESGHTTLNRHSSFGKESDTEDSRKDAFHRLRSTRPKRANFEHTDSLSSGEEDDDDGFEIWTAEHLFSNLLSRVRNLTQKLNVEDGGRHGFPNSRLLSHFDHGTNFWNFHNRLDPLSRHSSLGRSTSRDRNPTDRTSSTPWRRSASRDLASDIESVFKDTPTTPTTRPRGDKKTKKENLNLADLDLKQLKLSDEDALALSYLTPGLSRRIQKQLLSQLAPSDVKKLQRTLSSCENKPKESQFCRRSVDRITSEAEPSLRSKSGLPVKSRDAPDYSRATRSMSLREPRNYTTKERTPESSYSESLSRNEDPSTDSSQSYTSPLNKLTSNKTEMKKPSPRRISRFLRADFFDTPKEESVLDKEKKDREMETQKVLKEIRDKRKFRLNARRESEEKKDTNKFMAAKENIVKETDLLLSNVSNNIKNLENNVKTLHDYVNMPVTNELHDYVNVKAPSTEQVVKKNRISKLVRPKSYPTESCPIEKTTKVSPEKESKISRLRKGFSRQGSKERTKEDKNETNEEEKGHKNKLLQSIEKKLEKFRSNQTKDIEELKAIKEKKSGVENAIKRLREQSLPRNLEHCTESGLIKRAVSVEDLTTTNKPLQASRKSVTKILGLFKKYEEQDKKKKKAKSPEEEPKKAERPRSLLLDKMKTFQCTNNTKEKNRSKLPFRRSLNLDNVATVEVKTNQEEVNRNSVLTDDSLLSPDDVSETWSVCSEAVSPLSPNGHVCSGDENESVIDRIRRKSFYTRFNEKKRQRPRNYDYGSLDRRAYDYNNPRRSSYVPPEPKRDYKTYTRSASLLNDYVNVPNRYQTYSSKIARPSASIYSDSEDNGLDELLSTAKSRKYSSPMQTSMLSRTSVSPLSEFYRATPTSSE